MSQVQDFPLPNYEVNGQTLTISCDNGNGIIYNTTRTRDSSSTISGVMSQDMKKLPMNVTKPYSISEETEGFRVFHLMLRENLL